MTVENKTSKTEKLVMGSATYDFLFDVLLEDPTEEDAKRAIRCVVSDGLSESELEYGMDYSVILNEDGKGGVVTVTDPKNDNWTIIIYREYQEKQGSDYKDYNAFPAETLEQNLDKLTMILQQHTEELERSVKVSLSSNVQPEILVEHVERVYENVDNIDIVANDITNVNLVAAAQENIDKVADNLQAVLEAPTLAKAWAVGSDDEVPEEGEHSSKGNAGLAFAIANADEDVPISDFDMPAAVVIKGEKGDPGPQLEECLNAIEAAGNAVLSDIDTAQAKADASLSTIKTNKDLVLDTAAEVLAYKEAAAVSATNAAASEALANDFANADEDVIVAVV